MLFLPSLAMFKLAVAALYVITVPSICVILNMIDCKESGVCYEVSSTIWECDDNTDVFGTKRDMQILTFVKSDRISVYLTLGCL